MSAIQRRLAGLFSIGVVVAACSADGNSSERTDVTETGAAMTALPAAALEIMNGEEFATARWSVLVEPVDGGAPVFAVDVDKANPMASTTKMFSVGTWLDVVGPDHRIETPVYGVGSVDDGVLDGDLVLRAMGDFVMGGRNADSGEIGYGVPPQASANAVPGARPAPGDPLAGLDALAQQVADAGVVSVVGDVLIDDRLFEPWTTDRPLKIGPIAINDNLLAVVTAPAEEGRPGVVRTIPETAAFVIVNETVTVAEGEATTVRVESRGNVGGSAANTLVITGDIAADADERLNVFDVEDPVRYARTLFIEALDRAGVAVVADPLAANDVADLAVADDYADQAPLATIESADAAALATFILKTSNNFAADLTLCLLAVHDGSTECEDGFDTIRTRLDDLGIAPGEVWLFDGSGSGASATTPRAMSTWLRWMYGLEWGERLPEMLPILGVDGSLALSETDSASTGRVQAKTGTWAMLDASTARLLVPSQSLAGFMDGDDGQVYAFTLFMNGASFETPAAILDSSDKVARVAAAIQQTL